jgi:hypothetical protein
MRLQVTDQAIWGRSGADSEVGLVFSCKRAALQHCSVEGGFEEHDMVSSEALAKWSARPSARNGHGSESLHRLDCCSTSDGERQPTSPHK